MNALGKVPTLFGTVINITIFGRLGQEAADLFHTKAQRKNTKALRKICALFFSLVPLCEISLTKRVVLVRRKRLSQAVCRCSFRRRTLWAVRRSSADSLAA